MIAFVTLLLGLVVGPRQVELSVQEPVASVEIRLDGSQIGHLKTEPWVFQVDFGEDLRPHRLAAIAYDPDGKLLGTAEQIVNYSRSSFEAALALDPKSDPQGQRGRVIWEGAFPEPPRHIELRFDSRDLAVDAQGGFVLPPFEPDSVHLIEATITFADDSVGLVTLTLGGDYVDSTSTTLTAVPLASPVDEPWSRQQVETWLEVGGQPAQIFSVEAPEGRLVVLRDNRLERSIRAAMPWRDYKMHSRHASAARLDYEIQAISARPLEGLPGTFSLSTPVRPAEGYGSRKFLLFDAPLVPETRRRQQSSGPQKLWDSLAVAGLQAARSNRPRAVLLMIGHTLVDDSRFDPRQTLAYLASIQVPLLIWAPDHSALEHFGLAAAERVFLGARGLDQLEIEIGRELASQTMVWLVGDYLPNEISLTSAVPTSVTFLADR